MDIGGLDTGARAVIGLSVVAAIMIVVTECAPRDAPIAAPRASPSASAVAAPTASPSTSPSATVTDKDAKAGLLHASDLPAGWTSASIDWVRPTIAGPSEACGDLALALHSSQFDGAIANADTDFATGKKPSPTSTVHEAIGVWGDAASVEAVFQRLKAASKCPDFTLTLAGRTTKYTVSSVDPLVSGADEVDLSLNPDPTSGAKPTYLDVTVVGSALVVLNLDGAIVNSGAAPDLHTKAVSRATAALSS